MALWNKVTTGFNADDETVNFGARTVAENNGSIYETSTLATIQSDGQVIKNPNVSTSIQHSMLCVAVDKSLTIFSDESCFEIILSIAFDSLITAYCMSKDGPFLFLALATGVLHCVHIPSGGKQVFEENIKERFGDCIVKIFLQDEDTNMDIILVTSSGVIYGIKNFDAKFAHSALVDDDDEDRLQEIVNKIEYIQIFKGLKTSLANCINLGLSSQLSIVTIGKNIQLWPSDRCCDHLGSLPFQYTKIQFFKDYGSMICLRDDGALSIVCLNTLLGTKIRDDPVADFVTVQDESSDPYQILILSVPEKEEATTLLEFLSFPDFESKFKIAVSITTYLIDVVDNSIENIVFLEYIKSPLENIETIRVKAIVESKPEYRLQRLLRREKFDEAELFAKKFQLSLASVYTAKAAAFINQLGPWTNEIDDTARLEKFISTLDKINDVEYIYDCCNNALTSNYKQIRNLLLYAHQRISRHMQEVKSQDIATLLATLNATLRKLETFELIEKMKVHVEPESTQDVEEWIRFSRANLLQECVKHLSVDELEVAAAIWIRHLSEMAPMITPNVISNIFDSISETLEPSKLWPWLSHFVPSVISLLPSALSAIILWGYKKAKSLEKYHRKEWPLIGLDFARGLIDLLPFQVSTSKNTDLHRLMTLVQVMTDLLELKSLHKIVLSLEMYQDEPTNVVHLLLNKAHAEVIPNLIEQFLHRYMLNNSLQNDQVLCSYIQKTLQNSKSWWFWDKAPWEQRISTVIGYIRNVQNRLQQIMDVLKKAPVPWSSTITTLAESSYKFDHPLVSTIRNEANGVAVKLILKKYGYAHVGLCTKLFRYIIKQDRKDMINDICELTKADDSMRKTAFCFCTNHHLNIGNIDKAMDVLRHVDDDTARYCCQQIVYVTIACLRFKKRDAYLVHYIEALGIVEAKLRHLLSRQSDGSAEFDDALKSIPYLKRIYKLDMQFNIWINLEKYHTEKAAVLVDFTDRLIIGLKNNEKTVPECVEALEKVSNLLDLPPLTSVLEFYDNTKNLAILKHAIIRMVQRGITSRDESTSLTRLCFLWISNADQDPEISMLLKKLCVSNMINCYNDQLDNAIVCHKQVTVYMRTIGSESSCESESEHNTMNFDDHRYTLYTIYTDAAVSSGRMLFPLFRDSLKIWNFYTDDLTIDDDSINQKEIALMVQNLREKAKKSVSEHHDYSLLHIVTNMHYGLISVLTVEPELIMETQAVLSYCLYSLLRKIVGARSLDIALGLACLFMLTEEDAMKWLSTACQSLQTDLVRHREVVRLGYEYCRTIKLDAQLHKYECLKLLHRWGRRLTEYGISYKEMFSSDMEQKRSILKRVVTSKKSNLSPLLVEFCRDFGFDLNDCFLLYLEVLLSTWQPKLNFTMVADRKEMKIDENDVRDLNVRCKEVAAKIEDKILMERHLLQLSSQINFYHYEVFLTMLDIVGKKDVEKIEYLCFLQNYTRYGRPTEIEREEWANLGHDNSLIPPISQWRLPVLHTSHQFKLISSELSLKTYETWLTIAPVLRIQSHVICTLAVKSSVTEAWNAHLNDRNRSEGWLLHPCNSALLKEIKKCIGCINQSERLHYGTAALYFVMNHTPQGADQVAAAQECFASAQLWEQQSTEPDESMLAKIKDKYLKLTSKHILHTHGLGEDRYLSLIGHPEKLLRELYKDESIPERCKGATQRRPDVNSAANALGRIFSINMTNIRYGFLKEWLQTEIWESGHNDSVTLGFAKSMGNTEENSIEEDNLLRACYIFESEEMDTEKYANFLMNIGFEGAKEDGYGAGIRFRALRVLESIMDEVQLQDLTKHDLKSFRQYMKSLQYLNELEHLGLGYSINSFESCSKHKLAEILLKTQFYVPRALSLIVQICIDFGIQNRGLLNATLEQMAKQPMVKELEKFLPVIGTMRHMVNGSGYVAGWQVVIANPFGKLDTQPTPKQIADCVGSLRLLHACPVLGKLEFNDIMNRCIHCHQGHLVAALLPFLSDKDADYVLKAIKQNFKIPEVVDNLIGLRPKGILTVSQSLLIMRSILNPDIIVKLEAA